MEQVVIYLTDEGAKGLRSGSDIARVGDLQNTKLTFEPGTIVSPTSTGYEIITPNPHRFDLPAWAVCGVEQALTRQTANAR